MEQIVNEDTNDADYWRKLAIEQQAEIKRLSLYAKLADEYGLSIFFDFAAINEALGVCVGHCDPILALDAIENLKATSVQEPVAIAECHVVHGHMCQFLNRTAYGMQVLKDGDKLYIAPQPAAQLEKTE